MELADKMFFPSMAVTINLNMFMYLVYFCDKKCSISSQKENCFNSHSMNVRFSSTLFQGRQQEPFSDVNSYLILVES